MTQHLTTIHEPKQDRCIKQTYDGQASWAGWKAPDKLCPECRHFEPGTRKKAEGSCTKYRMLTQRAGKKFPTCARACQYFLPKGQM